MKTIKSAAGVVAAGALAALLVGCSSGGTGNSVPLSDAAGSSSSAPSPSSSSVPQVVPPTVSVPSSAPAGQPAPAGASLAGFPSAGSPTSTPSQPSSGVPVLTAPVTYESVSFPTPYNCAQSGTTYYTAPNVAIAMDVTVLVNSPTLARDLVVAAPNPAPRGLSNASRWISATPVGKGVWRATYRTYASLYQPKFNPLTIDRLRAASSGSSYTITFPTPVSVTLQDCHS